MENMMDLHNDIMFFLVFMLIFVFWILVRAINLFNSTNSTADTNSKFFSDYSGTFITHNSFIEIVWTVVPCMMLLLISMPSFALIYKMDSGCNPLVTLKVTGRQWYWTYELSDFWLLKAFSFDSYMLSSEDTLLSGKERLLGVDNKLFLPVGANIRMLVTSSDVLHSFAVPSFGIKVDACPGRLNEVFLSIDSLGIFFGQCSEICGVNHGFMPIMVRAVPMAYFKEWTLGQSLLNFNSTELKIYEALYTS